MASLVVTAVSRSMVTNMQEQLYRRDSANNQGVILELGGTWYNIPLCVIIDIWRDLQIQEMREPNSHLHENGSMKWKTVVMEFVEPGSGGVDPNLSMATQFKYFDQLDQNLLADIKELFLARDNRDLKAYEYYFKS
jgi:hypothetical protein